MAHVLEEGFASMHIRNSKSILELGPGNFCWALSHKDKQFVGVDLFGIDIHASSIPNDLKQSHIYKVGNILQEEPEEYDATVALSSFEHVGMEFPNVEIGKPNYTEELAVAEKLIRSTKKGGRIIITTPGGIDTIYGIPKAGGHHELFNGNPLDYKYMFRSYTPSGMVALFMLAASSINCQLIDIDQAAHRFNGTPEQFFDKDKWEQNIDLTEVSKTDYATKNILLCTAYERVK